MQQYSAFGLTWQSDLSLNQFQKKMIHDESPDIVVTLKLREPPLRQSGVSFNNFLIYPDGLRFMAGNDAIFDLHHGQLIDVYPGPAWNETLTEYFYGSVVFAILTQRGYLAFHGTSLAFDKRGLMICGRKGMGKSTVSAALIALGGQLIADDLTVIKIDEQRPPMLLPGRTNIRLYPDLANLIEENGGKMTIDGFNAYGKVCARMKQIACNTKTPLQAIVILNAEANEEITVLQPAAKLIRASAQQFRPRLAKQLPGYQQRHDLFFNSIPALRVAVIRPPAVYNAKSLWSLADKIKEFIYDE